MKKLEKAFAIGMVVFAVGIMFALSAKSIFAQNKDVQLNNDVQTNTYSCSGGCTAETCGCASGSCGCAEGTCGCDGACAAAKTGSCGCGAK